MGIESALNQWKYECWCNYNHEHIDESGNWVDDTKKCKCRKNGTLWSG